METVVNIERAKELSKIFTGIEVEKNPIYKYMFVVTWKNIIEEDGSNATTVKYACGEDEEDAKDTLINLGLAKLTAIGYQIQSVELVGKCYSTSRVNNLFSK